MPEIVWQYSEAWQKQQGIFSSSGPTGSAVQDRSRASAEATDRPSQHSDEEDLTEAIDENLGDAPGFVAARDKFEAVNRISRIAGGGAERLGRGSKERKSVLETLGTALDLPAYALAPSKTVLASSLAELLGVQWDDDCVSTGETITLRGLNQLLRGAEGRFSQKIPVDSPLREAERITKVIVPILQERGRFDIKTAVTDMREAESTQWRQQQWQGWFFEHITLGPCFGQLGGEPRKRDSGTKFDYSRNFIWDFKAHSAHETTALLNDVASTEWALDQGGLGFVILSGVAETEDWARAWQDEQKDLYPSARRRTKTLTEEKSRERLNSGPKVKSAFTPTRLDFFFFPDRESWQAGVDSGMFGGFQEGFVNSGGSVRKGKFKMTMSTALVSENFLLSVDLTT